MLVVGAESSQIQATFGIWYTFVATGFSRCDPRYRDYALGVAVAIAVSFSFM